MVDAVAISLMKQWLFDYETLLGLFLEGERTAIGVLSSCFWAIDCRTCQLAAPLLRLHEMLCWCACAHETLAAGREDIPSAFTRCRTAFVLWTKQENPLSFATTALSI